MEKRNRLVAIITSLILLSTGIATATTVINYQGLLTDSASNPVPDDTYQIIFSIWDDPNAGSQLWTETHPAVQTSNGHFNVELGNIDPINLDDLGSAALYLQLQVETEPPMDPRIQLNWVPYGAISQRVLGDVVTDEGSLTIQLPEAEQLPLINLNVDSATANVALGSGITNGPSVNMQVTVTTEAYDAGMTFFGAEGGPSLKAGADPDAAGIIIVGGTPTDGNKSINMQANTVQAGIIIVGGMPSGDSAIVEMGANNGAELTVNFAEPLDNQAHGVGLAANSGLADVNVYFAEPLDERRHGVQVFSDSSSANINLYQELAEGEEIGTPMLSMKGNPNTGVSAKIFNPLLEPPSHDPMIEMGTAPGNNASFKIFQPQPEPPGNLHESIVMSNTVNGGSRAPGASIKMFQPQPEPPGIPAAIQMAAQTNNTLFDVFKYTQDVTGGMDSTGMHMTADSGEISMEFLQGANTWVRMFANETTGGMEFFDDGSKYMGVEPSPFYNAGDMKMYDSTDATSIIVSSLGMVSIGTGVMGNILTVKRMSDTDPIADAWTTYSSRRWKRDIEPIEGSLDKVMNLRGVSFEWKDNGKEDIGLIAEEVAEVVPEVVAFEENGKDAKSVDYSRLVALLIEATKDQQKQIEELKAEISELKGEIK